MYDKFATDILVGKPDFVVFVPKLKQEIIGDTTIIFRCSTSRSGRIYVLWNQQTTSRGPHCGQMFGKYSNDDGRTWSAPRMVPMKRMALDPADPTIPPSWCNWQRPLRLGDR